MPSYMELELIAIVGEQLAMAVKKLKVCANNEEYDLNKRLIYLYRCSSPCFYEIDLIFSSLQ
ncbi:hypothetical protein T02_1089 [Trichinella nativa]|uniref:Uncharacterized protein n=1 Tax=Trichinella nativa TaxID=6335 RepID=A0A0V1L7Y9_9BILA|nr:hypothetical protein T02_1089 [Trichinella nativa]